MAGPYLSSGRQAIEKPLRREHCIETLQEYTGAENIRMPSGLGEARLWGKWDGVFEEGDGDGDGADGVSGWRSPTRSY
jgi:hypothetical protein